MPPSERICPGCGRQGEVVPMIGTDTPRCDSEDCRVKLFHAGRVDDTTRGITQP